MVRIVGLEPTRRGHRNLNPTRLPIPSYLQLSSYLLHRPVAVPDKIFGLMLFLDFIDRGHSLRSLHPPPAALPSLPIISALFIFYVSSFWALLAAKRSSTVSYASYCPDALASANRASISYSSDNVTVRSGVKITSPFTISAHPASYRK